MPRRRDALVLIAAAACCARAGAQNHAESAACKPVYLTFDTGHMGVAELIADVLRRHHVRVTFFAANEPTQEGDGTLGKFWAPWWRARAAEGHEFASHTIDHDYWRGDLPPATPGGAARFRIRPSAGPDKGRNLTWTAAQYCEALRLAGDRLASMTQKKPLPLFRAPGGKHSPALLAAAEACGYKHVGWAPAGFLGDELPSEGYPNQALLDKALRDIRAGDILVAHLGIWSRHDPWAPAVLEPLIVGLQQRGFCFRTLREHPDYAPWIAPRTAGERVMDWFYNAFDAAQQWLFVQVIQPLAFWAGAGNLLEQGYGATEWLLVGVLQIAVLVLVLGPAQRLWPVEPVTDRRAVRVDVLYTLLHRLGLFKLLMFFSFEAWALDVFGWLRVRGLPTLQIDQLWPGVTDVAWVSFILYLVLFDLVGYWLHRWQHHWHWWWQLHAVHHSQRQMTMWTDNRNHLLDSVITDLVFVTVALLVGVGPSQFVALVALSQLMESLQHANLRWPWPAWAERLVVSPRFHRHHHAIALSHEPEAALVAGRAPAAEGARAAPRAPDRFGVNYGILFPWWDMLFGSADWRGGYDATGIDDQVLKGRDYGRGFWAQQWLGLRRLAGLARR